MDAFRAAMVEMLLDMAAASGARPGVRGPKPPERAYEFQFDPMKNYSPAEWIEFLKLEERQLENKPYTQKLEEFGRVPDASIYSDPREGGDRWHPGPKLRDLYHVGMPWPTPRGRDFNAREMIQSHRDYWQANVEEAGDWLWLNPSRDVVGAPVGTRGGGGSSGHWLLRPR